MVSTIYYVTQEKELLPAKEDFIENLIAPDEEQLCDFFENEVPFFVDRFNAFDRDFEPRFLENNEYFKIKEVDGIFEMELKEDAIAVLIAYSHQLSLPLTSQYLEQR